MPATDLNLLVDAARIAGRVAMSYSGKTARKWEKPDGAGPVTEADLAVNAMLEATLPVARPDYGWLSEESEDSGTRLEQENVFIIDPIDGTRSFTEGARTWAHSFAVSTRGRITAAVVYLPMMNKLYAAALGHGAYLNGKRLSVSSQPTLEGAAVLSTKANLKAQHWPKGLPGFSYHHRPSLAYRLAMVAQGRFDAMLTFRPSWEWDIAAGALIVQEAGGVITDQNGEALQFNTSGAMLKGVIAGGAAIHAQTLIARDPV